MQRLRSRRLIEKAEQEFNALIRAAQENGDHEKVSELREQRRADARFDSEESELAYSKWLREEASKFRVPLPARTSKDADDDENWSTTSFSGEWYLSRVGQVRVREEIDKEKARNRAAWSHYIQLAAAITGILGALIGLVSVWRGSR